MSCSLESALIEEMCYLTLHELVDALFEPVARQVSNERCHSLDEDEEDEEAPPLPDSPPLVSPLPRSSYASPLEAQRESQASHSLAQTNQALTRTMMPPPAPKRRRLGVSAGAHDQIILLRASLARMVEERDAAKRQCRLLEDKVAKKDRRMASLEDEITHLQRALRFHRSRRAFEVAEVTATKIKMNDSIYARSFDDIEQ